MFKVLERSAIALGVAVLVACGASSSQTSTVSTSTAHGTLAVNPPFRIASADAATFRRKSPPRRVYRPGRVKSR